MSVELELDDGSKVLVEPIHVKGITEAGVSGKVSKKVDEILSIIPNISSSILDAVYKMDKKPSSLSTEFGIGISAGGNIILTSVNAEAHFKVKLEWEFKK